MRPTTGSEIRAALVLAACLLLGGCASSVAGVTKGVLDKMLEEDATGISATFEAGVGLNPNVAGRPSPLRVRFYALKSIGAFERADYFAIAESDETLFGDETVYRELFTIAPGAEHALEAELPNDSEVRYVAVVGGYQDIDVAAWRATLEIRPNRDNEVAVRLDTKAVSMALGK